MPSSKHELAPAIILPPHGLAPHRGVRASLRLDAPTGVVRTRATDWIAAFKAAGRAANSNPSLPLEKYAGMYKDAWYGPVSIRMEDGKFIFRLEHTPKAIGEMQHWQFDTFKVHWHDRTIEDAFATFTLKPDGTIDHFTMATVSPLADFSFDYQDLYLEPEKPAGTAKK